MAKLDEVKAKYKKILENFFVTSDLEGNFSIFSKDGIKQKNIIVVGDLFPTEYLEKKPFEEFHKKLLINSYKFVPNISPERDIYDRKGFEVIQKIMKEKRLDFKCALIFLCLPLGKPYWNELHPNHIWRGKLESIVNGMGSEENALQMQERNFVNKIKKLSKILNNKTVYIDCCVTYSL